MNPLSASVSGRSNVLRSRIDDLTEREQQLLDALQEVRAGLAKSRVELESTERAGERVRAPTRTGVPEETLRRVVRALGTFTVSELAAELGCKQATAKKRLDAMIEMQMARPAGRVMGKAVYEFTKPTDEGEAFRTQQRHLAAVPEVVERAQPVAGVSRGGGARMITDKEVRQACQEAERRGWKLIKKGDGHFVLTKGSRRVSVAGTPRHGAGVAEIIRRKTR